jgi:hypothetical protein
VLGMIAHPQPRSAITPAILAFRSRHDALVTGGPLHVLGRDGLRQAGLSVSSHPYMSVLAPSQLVHCGQRAEAIDAAGTLFAELYGVDVIWRCASCGQAFAPGARRGEALRRRAEELATRGAR